MADVGNVGSELANRLASGVLWGGLAIILIGVIGFLMWYFLWYKKKFDIRVYIKSERSEDRHRLLEDSGAIMFHKKDKNYFLRLLNSKIDLPPPPYWVIERSDKGDIIHLLRKSEDEFIYLAPPIINKTEVHRVDKTLIPISMSEQKQLEGDIAYWNIKTKDNIKKMFDPESLFMKILPYIGQLMGGVILIFILWILFDKLPTILGELTRLTQELRTLKGAEVITTNLIWSMLK